ncbi:hypothetical protein [Quatrionicoccus australiensis]|uniref:hypothetical protein n=1 Tax=Quatrionicoccus australiensis TaxID=138118 RepID=UPI001CFBE81F|nr:hypothetical protein [Quatrionicoccus australiensis]MCB4359595.1 hypothetical protein [Quatrionicoccus australiensis]
MPHQKTLSKFDSLLAVTKAAGYLVIVLNVAVLAGIAVGSATAPLIAAAVQEAA